MLTCPAPMPPDPLPLPVSESYDLFVLKLLLVGCPLSDSGRLPLYVDVLPAFLRMDFPGWPDLVEVGV